MKEKLERILQELKEEIGIKEEVKVKLKRFKVKIASVSLRKRVIYLDADLVKKLSDKELRYLLAHELLHLKYGLFHTAKFQQELLKVCGGDVSVSLCNKALRLFRLISVV